MPFSADISRHHEKGRVGRSLWVRAFRPGACEHEVIKALLHAAAWGDAGIDELWRWSNTSLTSAEVSR